MSATTRIYCPKCRQEMELDEALLAESILCQHCGHEFRAREGFDFEPAPVQRANPNHPALTGSKQKIASPLFGIILVLIGVAGVAYFALFFDVSVTTENGMQVANLDLMNQRQIGVIACVGVGLMGAIFAAAASLRR